VASTRRLDPKVLNSRRGPRITEFTALVGSFVALGERQGLRLEEDER